MGRAAILAAAAAAVVVSSATAAGSSPPKPTAAITVAQARELAELYVRAVNEKAALKAFLARDAEPVPPEALENWFDDQRWIHGGVDLIGVRVRPGANVVELALRGRLYGGVQGMEVKVSGGPQPRVVEFAPSPAPAWSVSSARTISKAQLAREVEGLVGKGCAADRFSGAVLLADGDQILVSEACGEASRRYHVPNTVETRFNIGSMDKMFTTVAAMQLVEAGKLSLDATLDQYLDESWLNRDAARRVTVWQLLTHTSGLTPDVAWQLEEQPRERYRELDDYKPLVRAAHVGFEPGSKFAYSNTGMLLMGAVIAKASGEDYFDYVRAHIFQPAGMTSTGSYAADDPVERIAVGYSPTSSAYGWRENTVKNLLRGMPAGNSYSTVGDLHRFARALQSGKLLSPASLERLWADPDHHDYGAGFELGDGAVGRVVGHSGLFYGVSTRMRIYLDSGYVAVVLANMDRAAPPLLDAIEGQMIRTKGADLAAR